MDRETLSLFIDQLARYIGNTTLNFAQKGDICYSYEVLEIYFNVISKQKYINSLLTLDYFVRIKDTFDVTLCVRYSCAHILLHFSMLRYVVDTDTVMHISYCTLA